MNKKPCFYEPVFGTVCHHTDYSSSLYPVPEPHTHFMHDDLRFLDTFIRNFFLSFLLCNIRSRNNTICNGNIPAALAIHVTVVQKIRPRKNRILDSDIENLLNVPSF